MTRIQQSRTDSSVCCRLCRRLTASRVLWMSGSFAMRLAFRRMRLCSTMTYAWYCSFSAWMAASPVRPATVKGATRCVTTNSTCLLGLKSHHLRVRQASTSAITWDGSF